MREYQLTKGGKEVVRVTSQERDVILDYLYENGPTAIDRLSGLDRNARIRVRQLIKAGLVEVKDGLL